MQCVSPILVKKSFNDISDEAIAFRKSLGRDPLRFAGFVPCGKCIHCMTRRRRAWQFRLNAELHAPDVNGAVFMTLTRTDEHNARMSKSLNKKELQTLIKQVRNSGESFRYYAIGEYGPSTHRPHYHLLVYATGQSTIESVIASFRYYYAQFKRQNHSWIRLEDNGFIAAAEVTPARVGYITHYHINPKDAPTSSAERCFAIQSQGLGSHIIENQQLLKEIMKRDDYLIRDLNGDAITLPSYYRKKYNIYKPLAQHVSRDPMLSRQQYEDMQKYRGTDDYYRYKRAYKEASHRKKKEYNLSISQNTI